MISIKKYLDARSIAPEAEAAGLLGIAIDAYRSSLAQMAHSSLSVCPGLGSAFCDALLALAADLSLQISENQMAAAGQDARQKIEQWSQDAARHYQIKSDEVRDLLLAMLRTAEGVGARDQRCAGQIHEVTRQLKAVASLDDITQIRASIESSAALLKTSIDRMTEEGKAAITGLRTQVNTYQAKLEEAEKLALRDALTGVLSRLCIERQIERRIAENALFCVAVIDIDGFKQINDRYGHLAGDELLKQFAGELASASRSSDVVGRWGGDEFIVLFNGPMSESTTQSERLERWICGNYTLQLASGPVSLELHASLGLAERAPQESMKDLLARADKAMYSRKPAAATR